MSKTADTTPESQSRTGLTADQLEPGDTLRDRDGHGRTNRYGPDYSDKLVVKKRWGRKDPNGGHLSDHDSWLLAPLCENGRTASDSFAVTFGQINSRLAGGRYQPVDCEVNRTLDIDALPVDADSDIYIRFGDIPNDERSYNQTDERYEKGVSVYSAELVSTPSESDAPAMVLPSGPKTLQILMLAHRDTYLLTGDKVGTGGDHEPLLRDVEIVAQLEYGDIADGWILSEIDFN